MSLNIKSLILSIDEKHQIFNPGVSKNEVESAFSKLKVLQSHKPAIKQLIELYTSRNGNKPNKSFDQLSYRFLKIKEAVSAYKFLNSPKESITQPYSNLWFPILENAGGYHIVLDFKTLKLIEWHHDGNKRPVVAASLLKYIQNNPKLNIVGVPNPVRPAQLKK